MKRNSFPWFGFVFLLGVMYTQGCEVDHVLSGDATVHIDMDNACRMEQSSDGSTVTVTCTDGRSLACLAAEIEETYLCQRIN